MKTAIHPEIEPEDIPSVQIAPRRSGGWLRRLQWRVRLAFGGDDEELVIENKTRLSWRMYLDYHSLGIIDADEQLVFRLDKHGMLNVRPIIDGDEVEYLMLPLTARIQRVRIYRRKVNINVEVYDMRAA